MKSEVLGFTINSNLNHTILLNDSTIDLTELELEVAPRSGTNETNMQWSRGHTDFLTSFAQSTTNGSITRESTTYCIMHYQGTTKKLSATYSSKATGQFTLNFDANDVTYTIRGVARGN